MQISLSEGTLRLIEEHLRSGRFTTPEDVVRAGLAALHRQQALEQWDASDLEAAFPGFRQKIEEGLQALRAGNFSDGDAFFEELERQEKTEASRTSDSGANATRRPQ